MTYIAGAQLAAAVSNAGALGIIETTSEQGRADLQRVRGLTGGSVGANIALIMNRDPAVVDLLVANDIRFVTTSAGDPSLFTDDIPPAADIIEQMWTGCRQVLAATADRLGPVTLDGF
jgi:enoyl-[acyl-carrier protein] reductase II